MLLRCVILVCLLVSRLSCDDGSVETHTVSHVEAAEENASASTVDYSSSETRSSQSTTVPEMTASEATIAPQTWRTDRATLGPARSARRRGRRLRGYQSDYNYRYSANNPYNPNSPYSFRGRPMPPQPHQAQPPQTYYDPRYNQYYDPYRQSYYGYSVYPQPAAAYYGYYPPQPAEQVAPPTPPATERIPDLYYVQKPATPDGQYQYKKMSVVQDPWIEGRPRRARATRWPQPQSQAYGQAPQGYYGYPYDPYNRRPPAPQLQYPHVYNYPQPPQQPGYQEQQPGYQQQQPGYQQQRPYWVQQYVYPKVPRGLRSRLRTGRPPIRPTWSPDFWSLTTAYSASFPVTEPAQPEQPALPTEQATEASGD